MNAAEISPTGIKVPNTFPWLAKKPVGGSSMLTVLVVAGGAVGVIVIVSTTPDNVVTDI